MIQSKLLKRRLEGWSKFKIQVFIYCYQRGKFQQHLPHNLRGSDVDRTLLFYFSEIFKIFLTKVQQGYCYTNSFLFSILHAVIFLRWKKIITLSRPATLRVFLKADQDIPLNEGTGEGESLPASLKVYTFPFYWIKVSHIEKFHILGKKVSLIAFR